MGCFTCYYEHGSAVNLVVVFKVVIFVRHIMTLCFFPTILLAIKFHIATPSNSSCNI